MARPESHVSLPVSAFLDRVMFDFRASTHSKRCFRHTSTAVALENLSRLLPRKPLRDRPSSSPYTSLGMRSFLTRGPHRDNE
jgi:hypothetical protein